MRHKTTAFVLEENRGKKPHFLNAAIQSYIQNASIYSLFLLKCALQEKEPLRQGHHDFLRIPNVYIGPSRRLLGPPLSDRPCDRQDPRKCLEPSSAFVVHNGGFICGGGFFI